jgi:alpha-1,2-mannosyltransferase
MAKKRSKVPQPVNADLPAADVKTQSPFPEFGPRTTWAILLGAFTLFFMRYILQFNSIDDMSNMDLPSFYSGSVRVFINGASPYNFPELAKVLEGQVTRTYPYLYPPPSLFLFYPLSLLSFAQAKVAFFGLNTLLLALLAWIIPLRLCRLSPSRNLWMLIFCLGMTMLFGPMAQTVGNGQVNLLVLSCLVLFWDLARTGRNYSSAFFLALAIILKTYPVVLLPMLLLSGRGRVALLTVLFLVLALASSILLLPENLWEDWLLKVAPSGSYTREPEGLFAPSTIGNQSINGLFSRLFTAEEWSSPIKIDPPVGAWLATLSAGLLVFLTIFATFLTRKDANALDKSMLISLPCIYLIAPFSWFHHLVYVLPTLIMLLCADWRGGPTSGVIFQALVLVAALTMSFWIMLDTEFVAVIGLWGLTAYAILSPKVELPGAAASA